MYLVDTNVFLEGLLEQKKVEIVRSFFQLVDLDEIYITDLALHSMGIILFKLKKPGLFNLFVTDMIENGMKVLSLSPKELIELDNVAVKFNLDFDDSYQYLAARNNYLQLISFDKDFDRTDINKKEPQALIN